MKPEQLKPIVTRLTNQLLDILTKLEPGLKDDYWASNPSFSGLKFLIQKALPEIGKAGENELAQILELAIVVKDYFKIHLTDSVFATCYVFIDSTIVDGKQYDFETVKIDQYFENNFSQISLKSSYSESTPFHYIMTDQRIDGFTEHTFTRYTAKKNSNGEISISEQPNPYPGEISVLPELDNELKIPRNQIINSVRSEWGKDLLKRKSMKIEKEFKQFAIDVNQRYEKLLNTLETLIQILKSEIEIKRNTRPASYIKLPFDKSKNDEIIELIYKELSQKNIIETSMENFHKIFSPDNTFTKIEWKAKPNLLVCLFSGFDFDIDGFNVSFPGLMQNTQNKWATLAEKFHIPRKSKKTPLPKYLEIIKRKNQKPLDLDSLLPLIEQLKEGWFK